MKKRKIKWKDLTKNEKMIVVMIRIFEILIVEISLFQFAVLAIEKLLK